MTALQIYLTASTWFAVLSLIVTYARLPNRSFRQRLFGCLFAGFAMALPIGLVAAVWVFL